MSRFQFIDDHRNTYPVKWLCHVLDVARSSYYAWVEGAPKRVARVMRERCFAGVRLLRRVKTTLPAPSDQSFKDLVQRDFTADTIGTRYVGNITYLPLAGGKNWYLATVIDLRSRKLGGWALADHMRTELVSDALKAAHATRGSLNRSMLPSNVKSCKARRRSSMSTHAAARCSGG